MVTVILEWFLAEILLEGAIALQLLQPVVAHISPPAALVKGAVCGLFLGWRKQRV